MTNQKKIRDQISQDHLAKAFKLFREDGFYAKNSGELSHLEGRLNALKKKEHAGVIGNASATREKNKIRLAALAGGGKLFSNW